MIRWFIEANRRASRGFDRLLPGRFVVDGNRQFIDEIVPQYLARGCHVVDVGGGRHPFVEVGVKHSLGLRVTGLDIDATELAAAPAGAYDECTVADITNFRGNLDADLVVCQAVLEHVADTEAAFASLTSLLRPGGRALVFVPCRNALFARANLLMPESIKRRILYFLYPESRESQGFRSYYDRCTPNDFRRLATDLGFAIERESHYWSSAYFTFLVPLHVFWRLLQLLIVPVMGRQLAESFAMVLLKPCDAAQVK